MAKTISVAQLGHGGASRAIRDAQDEPVVVTKENRPAAWIVSADRLAETAAARNGDRDVYNRVLELIAVELFDNETLTSGQAARLAGLNIHDFIDLCARMNVPILREPPGGIRAEFEALKRFVEKQKATV